MRSSSFAVPAALALAVTMGACGSASQHVSAPSTPAKLSLSAAVGKAEPAIYPQRAATYVLAGNLADLGTAAPVRKLVAHDTTGADVTRIAGALGMHGEPHRTADGYELRDGDATLTIDTAGGVTTVNSSRNTGGVSAGGSSGSAVPPSGGVTNPPIPEPVPQTTPMPAIPPPVDVPSAADAVNIAQSLLDDLGVLTGAQWSHNVVDAGGVAVSCAPNADCAAPPSPPVYARTVTYELVVDGVQVPGVSWSVTIGEHRRVSSLSGTWVRSQEPSDYPLLSTSRAFDALQHGHAQYVGPEPLLARGAAEIAPGAPAASAPITLQPTEVHVTGVTRGVARWDGTENGSAVAYLLPTYRFHANIDGSAPYDIEILALDPATFSVVAGAGSTGKEVEK